MTSLFRARFLLLILALPPAAPLPAAPVYRAMQEADAVLGNAITPDMQIIEPRDIVADIPHRKIYVVDAHRNRVLRFAADVKMKPARNPEAVFGQVNFENSFAAAGATALSGPSGACVDIDGRLWVADTENHRVLRFDEAWKRNSGAAANAVLGQKTFLGKDSGSDSDQMNRPHSLTIAANGDLYVADTDNHRVLRFINAKMQPVGADAGSVLGQPGFNGSSPGTASDRLNGPQGVCLIGGSLTGGPDFGILFVADTGNHRVLIFNQPADPSGADRVLGQSGFTDGGAATQASRMNLPKKLTVADGRLWVADKGNHRVLRFDDILQKSSGAPADGVLGQSGFVSGTEGRGATRMERPEAVLVDPSGVLSVGDAGNHRMLRFNAAHGKADGSPADGVLGAAALVELPEHTLAPGGLAVCPLTEKLFVSDTGKNRVLRYQSQNALRSGAAPEAAFGQSNLQAGAAGTSAARMEGPLGVCVDTAGRLWVADAGNNRVLRFDGAASAATGTPASAVLGQAYFSQKYFGDGASEMNWPAGVSTDAAGRLWVSDSGNNRVLRFNNAAAKANGAAANGVLGHNAFGKSLTVPVSAATMSGPAGLHADTEGRLWVADAGNHRVLRFDNAASKANGAGANAWPGQVMPSSATATTTDAGLRSPADVRRDQLGRLWVADRGNRRLVRYDQPLLMSSAYGASARLGQPDWTSLSGMGNCALNRLTPVALAPAPKSLEGVWAADAERGRVLRFTPFAPRITAIGLNSQGKIRLTIEAVAGTPYRLTASTDLENWSAPIPLSPLSDTMIWTDPAPVADRKFYRVSELAD